MEKLLRKLRRELARNPKQTAVLGAGLLLAVYFWAPLMVRWLGIQPAPPTAVNGFQASVDRTPDRAAAGGATAGDITMDWRELWRRMVDDPLRRLPDEPVSSRDPFQPRSQLLPQTLGAAPSELAQEVTEPATVDPPTGEWRLEGVMLGRRTRAAIINGRAYRERDRLPAMLSPRVAAENTVSSPLTERAGDAVLAEVHADHVIVSVGTEIIRLELKRPSLAPGDLIATGPGESGT